jgi:hypothetical protein
MNVNECEILLIHSWMGFLFPRSAEVKAIFLGFFVIPHANGNNMKAPQKGRALKELNLEVKSEHKFAPRLQLGRHKCNNNLP